MSKFCLTQMHGLRAHTALLKAIWLASIALSLSTAPVALAQSAADKATARQLATQGIQSFQQGKTSEALDLLQKAQQLYDAPVHLIYIGRAQAALGKFVEASETFRRLVRTDLPAGAPQAFKDAVADAHKELQTLEPKIPSLRIDVKPADAPGLKLKLDGEPISAVVVGINRPTNPGRHTVEATANGFDTATANVELAHGGKQTVVLQLRAAPGGVTTNPVATGASSSEASVPGDSGTGAGAAGGTSVEIGAVPKTVQQPFDRGNQIVIGVRGIGVIPMGTLRLGGTDAQSVALNGTVDGTPTGKPNTDGPFGDRFGMGGGVHAHVGFRFALSRLFALTPQLSYEYQRFQTGSYYNQNIGSIVQNYALGITNSSSVLQMSRLAHTLLLGATLEFPIPSDAWMPSYYMDLSFVLMDRLSASGTLTTGTSTCNITDKFSGNGIRLGAGILLPANRFLRLAAGFAFTAISSSSRNYTDNCPRTDPNNSKGITVDSSFSGSDKKTHSLLMAGIGGDFLFGL